MNFSGTDTVQRPEKGEDGGDGRNGIQVIARAAAVLRALENQRAGLSLGQIAKIVNLPRSTVQRIVNALETEELVSTKEPGGGVRLGMMLTRLAASAHRDITALAHPLMEQLARRVRETVDLSVLRGSSMLFVDQIQSDRRLRTVSAIGAAFPLYCTANGKAVLATLSDTEVERLVGNRWEALTPHTHTSLASLFADLAKVRETGFAYDLEEHTEGISAIGVAIHGPDGSRSALSLGVPSVRFDRQLDLLRQEISRCRDTIESAIHL